MPPDAPDAGRAPGAFSTYLGGSGQDEGTAVGRKRQRDYFVAGITYSTDFPIFNPLQYSLSGTWMRS